MSSLSVWLSNLNGVTTGTIRSAKFSDVERMLKRLSLDTIAPQVITVAGTNGKGSVVAILEAIYHAAGYHVGAFTSPHLLRFNERIRIDCKEVGDQEIVEVFQKIEQASGDISLGYFQYAFLAALMLFKRQVLDVVILEVGIGGRYDAVNTVDSDLSVITQISYDHEAILGDQLSDIARQKAGIMRTGKPVVIADRAAQEVLRDCADTVGAKAYFIDRDFSLEEYEQSVTFSSSCHPRMRLPTISLLSQNYMGALMAIQLLQNDLPVLPFQIEKGVRALSLLGRQHYIVLGDAHYLFDVAHNPDGIRALVRRIAKLKWTGKTRVIFGAMHDKAIHEMVNILMPIVDSWEILPLDSDRAATYEEIRELLLQAGVSKIDRYEENALEKEGMLTVITGSFLTVASIWPQISGRI